MTKTRLIALAALLVFLSGCGMSAKEVAESVEDCKEKGLRPVEVINTFTYETISIVCRLQKGENNND